MKSKKVIGLFAAALFLTAGVVQAGDGRHHPNNHNLSKRPHQEAPVENKAESFDGATLVKEGTETEKASESKHKQLRINMLGRRPYVEDIR